MERFIQHEPLFIRHFTSDRWPFPPHSHNHFELMFIHSGSGYNEINGKRASYKAKCIFLLSPDDYHFLEVTEETEFSVLKFTNRYLDGVTAGPMDCEWNQLVDHLLVIGKALDTALVTDEAELHKIEQLMRLITGEWEAGIGNSREVMLYLIRGVFALIKRNAFTRVGAENQQDGQLYIEVMNYIHLYIQNPEKLSLSALSTTFNHAPNYLSSLFKQKMGVSIKRYISDYKFKLIENKLRSGHALIKEISNAFGFNDLSHFNKFMKKQTGINPKEIRKQPAVVKR